MTITSSKIDVSFVKIGPVFCWLPSSFHFNNLKISYSIYKFFINQKVILHNRSHILAPFNSFFSQTTTLDCFHYLELFATTKQIYIPTKVAGTVPLISNYILVLLCVISLNYILHVTITLEPSTLELFLVVKDGTELGLDSIRIFNHKYIEGKCTWLSSGYALGIWICGALGVKIRGFQ